jgi:hypothetical protein
MRCPGTRREDRIAALSRARRRDAAAHVRRSGAAMIEAVVVLPVLLLALFAVGFMRERYLGRQQAALAARRCAWAHAIGGCGEVPPPGCSAAALAASSDDPDTAAIMSAARANAGTSKIDVFNDVPVLGEALDGLFGTHTGARAVTETTVPWNRSLRVVDRTELIVLCNERPRDVLAAAQNVFCRNVPLVPCAGGQP